MIVPIFSFHKVLKYGIPKPRDHELLFNVNKSFTYIYHMNYYQLPRAVMSTGLINKFSLRSSLS